MGGAVPGHVAVIMDGNGRWARERGLPRHAGHAEGMKAVRETVEGACAAGVGILSLFAFSTDNWNRPRAEIDALMGVLKRFAASERRALADAGVRVRVIGDLDRLDEPGRAAVDRIVRSTIHGRRLLLNLLISYGGREEIVDAARRLATQAVGGALVPGEISAKVLRSALSTGDLPDPDLLIRTSGEYRISNFMLWHLAYSELHFASVYWPDFTREHFFEAILDYQRRERRFGRVATR